MPEFNIFKLMDLFKQAGRLRSEGERLAEELKKVIVEGSAGGGMVTVRMNGKQELLDCKIDPQVFVDQDAELLEDLVVAATNQATEKSRKAAAEKMGEAFGGMNLPGLSEALGGLGGPAPSA